MAEKTAIEWCDATWNPWWGCQKVSPACDHCYAERDAKRYQPGRVLWGVGSERRTFGDAHWAEPLKWAKRSFMECHSCHWRGDRPRSISVTFTPCPRCRADLKLARRRVFCASMSDWLDIDALLDEFVRLLDTIRRTPELDWLLLSKRIGNWRKRLEDAAGASADNELFWWIRGWLDGKPPANIWLGSTVVTQEEADRDVPKLLLTPARVRFLSIEPMLGPITLPGFNATTSWCPLCAKIVPDSLVRPHEGEHGSAALPCASVYDMLHWVICGGESGPHARPPRLRWLRSLRDQCAAAGVAFMLKQIGEYSVHEVGPGGEIDPPSGMNMRGIKQWRDDLQRFADVPKDARVAEVFKPGAEFALPVGKKAAGRLLDGRTHDEFPR